MLEKILSTNRYAADVQALVRNYFLGNILISFLANLTFVFTSLYLIDLFGFIIAGFLFSVTSLSQFIFDYPTGARSDYIGQRGVAFLAFLTMGLSYLLIGTAKTYDLFLVAMLLSGLGAALLSGVIQTWFSNNYQVLMTIDSDRSIYGALMARIRSIGFLLSGVSIIIGSVLATYISRQFVFQLTGILLILTGFVIYSLLKDFVLLEKEIQSSSVLGNITGYFKLLYRSVSAIVHDKLLFSTIIGLLLISTSLGQIFFSLLFFPILFTYTGTDSLVGLTQSAITFVLAFNVFFISIYAKKFRKHHLPVFMFLYVFCFLNGLILLFVYLPPTNVLNFTAVIGIILLYLFFDAFVGEIGVNLQQRVFLDLIPAKLRNSIISFYSSCIAIVVAIFYPIVGFVVTDYGLTGGLFFLEVIGFVGVLFLIPIFFSGRMKSVKNL